MKSQSLPLPREGMGAGGPAERFLIVPLLGVLSCS